MTYFAVMKSHIPKGLTGLWRGRLVPDAGGSGMARADKTLQQVLFGRADANTAFADLRGLLRGLVAANALLEAPPYLYQRGCR